MNDTSLINLARRYMNRDGFLAIFTISFGGIAGLVIGIPIVAYVFGPLIKQPPEIWQSIRFTDGQDKGKVVSVDAMNIGETREVAYRALGPSPWAGTTGIQGAWLRRTGTDTFIAYALYCTHLGCPIHWLPQPKIFLCPCHGSVFNADGTVAGGPAPQSLFTYSARVRSGKVEIQTHALPIIG